MENILYQRSKVRFAEYIARAIIILAVPGILIICSIAALRWVNGESPKSIMALLGSFILIVFGLLLVVLNYSASLSWLIKQKLKNDKALIYEGPFYLLLHSFSRTETYKGTFVKTEVDYRTGYETTKFFNTGDLKLKIQKAAGDKILLVTVGDHSRYLNILTLECESDSWEKDVEALAIDSRAILLLPEISEGLLAEIKMLASKKLWQKTIIIMPPLRKALDKNMFNATDEFGLSVTEWEEMRNKLLEQNYKLPVAKETGMAFTINPNLSVNQKVKLFKEKDDWGIFNAITSLQKNIKASGLPLKEVLPRLEATLPIIRFRFRDIILGSAGAFLSLICLGFIMILVIFVLIESCSFKK